jgi:hypothetical protein
VAKKASVLFPIHCAEPRYVCLDVLVYRISCFSREARRRARVKDSGMACDGGGDGGGGGGGSTKGMGGGADSSRNIKNLSRIYKCPPRAPALLLLRSSRPRPSHPPTNHLANDIEL